MVKFWKAAYSALRLTKHAKARGFSHGDYPLLCAHTDSARFGWAHFDKNTWITLS